VARYSSGIHFCIAQFALNIARRDAIRRRGCYGFALNSRIRPRCGIGQGQTRECGDDSFGHKQEYTGDVFNACKMETRVFSAF
jgi:hypothetical protein